MRRPLLLLLALGCVARDAPATDSAMRSPAASPSVSAPAPDSATRRDTSYRWVITPRGFGPVLAGMTTSELGRALGESVRPSDTGCGYVRSAALPAEVAIMIVKDSVARIDVRAKEVRTAEGAGVGDTEASVRERYVGRVRSTPHKYTDGRYLIVSAPPDSAHLIIFETDGRVVTNYRAGRRPAVEYVEGCS